MTAKKKQQIEEVVEEYLDGDMTAEEAVEKLADDEVPVIPLRVAKPKAKPGELDYDWQAEYPDEEVFVFTSVDNLTIGMTKLSPARKPKPGRLRRLHREGGMSVMWYFIELVSTPTSLTLQEELDEEEYTRMLREWAEFAGIELSE
jgi:hypothetical protein